MNTSDWQDVDGNGRPVHTTACSCSVCMPKLVERLEAIERRIDNSNVALLIERLETRVKVLESLFKERKQSDWDKFKAAWDMGMIESGLK